MLSVDTCSASGKNLVYPLCGNLHVGDQMGGDRLQAGALAVVARGAGGHVLPVACSLH